VPATHPICGQNWLQDSSRSRQDFGRVPATHPICGQNWLQTVAEVAKTLDGMPAMHPIGGQIVYGPTVGKIVIGERPD